MSAIHQSFLLQEKHTFATRAHAAFYAEPNTMESLKEVLKFAKKQTGGYFIIGEGSNLLFKKDFSGTIIRPLFRGIEVVNENTNEIYVRAGAGENWDRFVEYCVQHRWYGPENLSLIPGSVGATPVQNIGAYGVEAGELIDEVEAWDTSREKFVKFSNSQCRFGYRDSFFKQCDQGRYIITHVTFRLKKKAALILDYGNVREVFMNRPEQTLLSLRQSIIEIRQKKLPDPISTGNAGSFFKNPVITLQQYTQLQNKFSNIPGYPSGEGYTKVPAAWLIEQAGWKGVREDRTGTWPTQPLVIVNYGGAKGEDIFVFSEKIRQDVLQKFNIELQREVTVL